MRSTMFRILGAALIAALALSPACSPPAEAQQKMINLNMGSTSSTSAVYAWCVATANVINKANLGLNVTVIESGAALDNLRKLKDGSFDFALSIDIPSAMQMYHGIDAFKGKEWKDVRVLFIRNVTVDRIYVRKDAGVKTFTELSGKAVFSGDPRRLLHPVHDEVRRGAQIQDQLHAGGARRFHQRLPVQQDRRPAEDQPRERDRRLPDRGEHDHPDHRDRFHP